MATVNYYVNPTTGNDAWDGTSPTFVSGTTGPKEHVQAMIDDLSFPITDEIFINLSGTVGSPSIFLEPSGKIHIEGLIFRGKDASLTILPEIWNQSNYENGGDPYGGSGAWNPADGNKPCVIPAVEVTGVNREINITGVTIAGLYTGTPGLKIDFGSMVALNYCAVGTFILGAHVVGGGLLMVNCAFTRNATGVLAENNAQIFCIGDNYIHNSLRYGIVVRWRSNLSFGSWWADRSRYYMDLTTTQPREKYSAIHAEGMSLIRVVDPTPDPFVINQAAVKILNPGLFKNDEYYGVSLESGSMLLGAQAIDFSMPINGQWTLTMPDNRQFLVASNSFIVR